MTPSLRRPLLNLMAALVIASTPSLVLSERVGEPATLSELVDREASVTPALQPGIPRPDAIAQWATPPADLTKAMLDRGAIAERYAGALPTADPAPRADPASQAEAGRLIAEATRLRADGRSAEAINLLRQAVRLDQTSSSSWREFGLLQLEQGNALGARTSLTQAIARGDRTLEGLLAFGRIASQFRDDQPAAAALLAVIEHPDLKTDPGARFIAGVELGQCLLRLGHLRAGAEHIAIVLDLPDVFDARTAYRDQLNEIYRSRRDLLQRAVQALVAIEQPLRALELLEAAARLPGQAGSNELAQRCYLLLRSGRPATAADLVISTFREGFPGPQTIELLAFIAEHSDTERLIAPELRDIRASLPAPDAARLRQTFTLAEAVVARTSELQQTILLQHLTEHPTDRAVLLHFVAHAEPAQFTRLLTTHPSIEPLLHTLVIRTRPDLNEGLDTSHTLRVLLRDDEFQEASGRVTEQANRDPIDFQRLIIATEILIESYRGDRADSMLDAAESQADTPAKQLATARALIIRDRYRDAVRLLTPITEKDEAASRTHRLLALNLLAEAHRGSHNPEQAAIASQTVLDIDPHNIDAAADLALSTGSAEDVKRLRAIPGSEPDIALVQAARAIESEQFDLAERLLLEAWDHPLMPHAAAESLARLWVRSGAIARAEQWLLEQTKAFPDRSELTVLLSRVRSEDRRPEDALDTIANAMISRPGSSALSRELERILREDFAADERWLSQARSRLSNAPSTFATLAERAEIELIAGDLTQSLSLAEFAIDLAPNLLPIENRLLNKYLEDASAALVNRPRITEGQFNAFDRIFKSIDTPSEQVYLGRLTLATAREVPDPDALFTLALAAGNAYPNLKQKAFIHTAQALQLSSRSGQNTLTELESFEVILELYQRAVAGLDPYPTDILGEWLDLAQQTQNIPSLAEAVETLGERRGPQDRRLRSALSYMLTKGGSRRPGTISVDMLADAAHYLGAQLSMNDQFPAARAFYQEALALKPDHIEANNSYGYRLLEAGEELDRAVEMIETAYRLAPTEAHIVDSMGWARYKQGQFDDRMDPEGARVIPGAVSLLRRAKTLAIQDDPSGLMSAFVVFHLGDALWASGDRERAAAEWAESAVHAQRAMREIRGTSLPLSIEVELQEIIDGVTDRLRAASEDRPPPIAPYRGSPTSD